MLHKFLLAISIALSGFSIQAQRLRFQEVRSPEEWYDLKQLAKQANKPVVLFIEADWCTYCLSMRKHVFKDPAVVDALQNKFMALSMDGEKYTGMQFMAEYQITAFPGFVFYGRDGQPYVKHIGSMTAQEFIAQAELSLARERRYPQLKEAYAARRLTQKGWQELLQIMELQEGREAIRPFAEEYVEQMPVTAYTNDSLSAWFQNYTADAYGTFLQMVAGNPNYVLSQLPSLNREALAEQVAAYNFGVAIAEQDSSRISAMLEVLEGLNPDSTNSRASFTWTLFAAETGDWKGYKRTVEATWPDTVGRETAAYRSTYELLQDFSGVKEARDLALEWITPLAEKDHFAPVYLKAYVLMLDGQTKESYQEALRAKSLATTGAQNTAIEQLLEELHNR